MKKYLILILFTPFLVSVVNIRLMNAPELFPKTAQYAARYDALNRYFSKQLIKQTAAEIVDYSQFLDFNKPRKSTDYIFIHHTATETATLAAIANFHMFKRHWKSVAYHYLVQKDGKIIRLLKPESTSAHAVGFNHNAVSVCFEGNFDIDSISSVQYKSGVKLLYALHTKYPQTKFALHREYANKTCPGTQFPAAKLIYEVTHFHIFRLWKLK